MKVKFRGDLSFKYKRPGAGQGLITPPSPATARLSSRSPKGRWEGLPALLPQKWSHLNKH